MNLHLIVHRTNDRPPRFYINGRRVSQDDYEFTIVSARLRGLQQNAFVTRRRTSTPGRAH